MVYNVSTTIAEASGKPRILIVTGVFPPTIGGAGEVPKALATAQPIRISVVSPANGDLLQCSAIDQTLPFASYRIASLASSLSRKIPGRLRAPLQFALNILWTRPRALRQLHSLLSRHPMDVLCVNTLLSAYWVPDSLLRRFPKLKTVFYLHGEEVNDSLNSTKLDQLAQHQLRKADAVIVISSFTRDRALRCGVAAEKIHLVHNGVDTERFCPGPPNSAILSRFSLQGKKILLCLARLDTRKGQDILIEALPLVLLEVPEAVVLIVGTGEDAPRLKSLASAHNLEEKVIFAGFAKEEEVVEYYRTADVYVMPNRTLSDGDTEGFGLVFLEAGACQKPVIGGRAGGVPDAILDGKTGLLVDGTSKESVASACIRLLQDPKLAKTMGNNGLVHSQSLTWEKQAERFVQVCQSIAS